MMLRSFLPIVANAGVRLLLCALLAATTAIFRSPTPAVAQTEPPPPTAYMLELADPPAAAVYAAQVAAAGERTAAVATQTQVARLLAAQASVRTELARHDLPVLFALQRVYNGVAVLAPGDKASELAALPGVVAVHPLIARQPDRSANLTLAALPPRWQRPAALAEDGAGLRLAIIDTGIDYLHTDFAGPGAGYAQNDTRIVGDVPGFPGSRIVGGYDFVGDRYNADASSPAYQPTPEPDPDPMDCYGHGTHVAGIAGGSGVLPGGTTYPGPYTPDMDLSHLAIAPGLAPRVDIYALKIFGCAGSSEVTELALEWAVDPNLDGDFGDRMDVVNLSLGSPFGTAYDTTAVAADHASMAGVVVVASAGNSGDSHFIAGAPSTAGRALSVAATQQMPAVPALGQPAFDQVASFSSRGPRRGDAMLKPDLAAPGVAIISAASGTGSGSRGLSGTSMAAPYAAGVMVLLRQLHPTWRAEELKALAMNSALPLVRTSAAPTATLFSPARVGAGQVDLAHARSTSILALVADTPGQVSLAFGSPEVRGQRTAVRNLEIVNKGNTTATLQLDYTPVTDMPGVTVEVPTTTIVVPPAASTTVPILLHAEATSMRRAGDAASNDPVGIYRSRLSEEAGHLWLWPAQTVMTATLAGGTLTQASQPGLVEVDYDPPSRQLAYVISLPAVAPEAISAAGLAAGTPGIPGNTLYPLAPSIAAPGGGSLISGTLTLDAHSALLLASGMMQATVSLTGTGGATLGGQLSPAPAPIHLPVHAAPRPVAAITVAQPTVAVGTASMTGTLVLAGQPLAGTVPPTDVVALATPLLLQTQSPNSRPPGAEATELDRYDHADLQYVGARVDDPAGADPMLYFGVVTYAPWSTPNEVRFDIYLDVDRDGTDDFRLFNADAISYGAGSLHIDAFVSALEELKTGRRLLQAPLNNMAGNRFDPGLYFGNVMVLPVQLAALGLAGDEVIDYRIETFSADRPGRIDIVPARRLNVGLPVLRFSASDETAPFVVSTPGTTIEVALARDAYAAEPVQRILLLHHHNVVDRPAEVLPIDYTWPARVLLPAVRK